MNLDSTQDIILLRNCVTVKIKELEQEKNHLNVDFSPTVNAIENYKKTLELLNKGDIESVINIFNNSIQNKEFSEFSKHILSTPPVEIAQEYIDLTKSLMINYGSYSDEKFEELKKAFYKGNENLNPEYSRETEYEEEPEKDTSANYLTEDMKISLDKLDRLIKQNLKTISASEFRHFSTQFKDITMELGKKKFQQSFDEQGKTIEDMNISYDTTQNEKSVYKADFILLDSSSQESNLTITEPASTTGFSSTYFQNLCYSYLEANKYANIDESLLDSTIISSKMADFRESYKKLDEMMTKCKITIAGNSIFYSSESEIEPSELDLDVACNSKPDLPSIGDEIEI